MSDPVIHKLKCAPVYYEAVRRGEKHFEIRLDDRGFQKGDHVRLYNLNDLPTLTIMGADPLANLPYVERRISWILTDGFPGLQHGYVALSLESI